MGAQNLFILKLCGTKFYWYSNKLWELKFVGIHTQKFVELKSGALSFVGTQNLWVHKICDDTKFQVGGREN